MKRTLAFLIFCLFLLPSIIFAKEQPFGFKHYTIGDDKSYIPPSNFICKDSKTPIADQICRYNSKETIAGAPVQLLLLYYYSDKLENISITFKSDHFSKVVSALSKKYGTGKIKTKAVQNRMGATFENRMHSWSIGNNTLTAKQYSTDLNSSTVYYRVNISLNEMERRKKSKINPDVDDL